MREWTSCTNSLTAWLTKGKRSCWRIWECPNRGVKHDRDMNAALNLKRIGILELKASGLCVSARGGTLRPSSTGGHEPMNRENLVPHQAA